MAARWIAEEHPVRPRADGRYAISEVGARPPGAQFVRLISYAHDTDMYRAWARLMIFDEFDPPERPFAAGAAYLRGQGTGRVKAVREWTTPELRADLGPSLYHWLRAQALAAGGDYALAQEELTRLASVGRPEGAAPPQQLAARLKQD